MSKRVAIDEDKADRLEIYCALTGTTIRDAVDAALELWLTVEAEVDLEPVTASQHKYVPVPVARPKILPMKSRHAVASR